MQHPAHVSSKSSCVQLMLFLTAPQRTACRPARAVHRGWRTLGAGSGRTSLATGFMPRRTWRSQECACPSCDELIATQAASDIAAAHRSAPCKLRATTCSRRLQDTSPLRATIVVQPDQAVDQFPCNGLQAGIPATALGPMVSTILNHSSCLALASCFSPG